MTEPQDHPPSDSEADEDARYRAFFPTENSTTDQDDDYAAYFPTNPTRKA